MADVPVIVVGVDGSETSVQALTWAVREAGHLGGRVRVVTAFDVPWTIFITPTYTDDDYARDAQEMLDRTMAAAGVEATGVPITAHIEQQRPGPALAAAAIGAEMLVVGSHGHGYLPGMHLGSVANYCVHHAPCPVVVIRPQM